MSNADTGPADRTASASGLGDGRVVELAVKCAPGQKNHWLLLVPSATDAAVGKVIQVVGSAYTGWKLEIKDNYAPAQSRHRVQRVALGAAPRSAVVDGYAPDPCAPAAIRADDAPPRDALEALAMRVALPHRNHAVGLPPMKSPLWRFPNADWERCQEWTRRLVRAMVDEGYLPPHALVAVDTGISHGLGSDQATYAEILREMEAAGAAGGSAGQPETNAIS